RHAQLVEPGVDQRAAEPLVERNRVRVEEHRGAAALEMRDHARQVAVEQRLADPVEEDPLKDREPIDDAAVLLPREILLGLAAAFTTISTGQPKARSRIPSRLRSGTRIAR